jgi:hypothetical protein
MTLIHPNGHREQVGHHVFNQAERTIIVPIAYLWGGQTYTFTYRAQVRPPRDSATQEHDIINRATVRGENPDGTTTEFSPITESLVAFLPTGDNSRIYIYILSAIALLSAGAMLYIKRKDIVTVK